MSDLTYDARAEEIARHAEFVRRLARWLLSDADLAEDVAQEALLTALRTPNAARISLRAWLGGVTRHLAFRAIRSETRRTRREAASAHSLAVPSAAETAARLEVQKTIVGAVRSLDEPFRTTVVLRFFDGLSIAEIATRFGVPEGTVKSRLSRALHRLRGRLDDEHGDRRIWTLLVVPLARGPGKSPVAAAGAGTLLTTGAILMMKKILLGLAALALAAGITAYAVLPKPGSPDDRRPRPAEVATPVAALPAAPARHPESQPALPSPAAPSPPAAPASASLVLVLQRDDGSPAAGAQILVTRKNGKTVGPLTAGNDGVVSVAATKREAVVAFAAPGQMPFREEMKLDPGRRVLHFPRGAIVSGIVVVKDQPPEGPVRLALYGSEKTGLTTAEKRTLKAHELRAETDSRGGFRFAGLPEGWHGTLALRGTAYRLVSPKGNGICFELPAPRTDLRIQVSRRAVLTGRIVTPNGSKPAAGVGVSLMVVTKNGGGGSRVETDDNGRFRITLPDGEIRSARLMVTDPDRVSSTSVTLDPKDLVGDHDVGDIFMHAVRVATFLIVDKAGQPVSGAVVAGMDDHARPSPPTGADGRTTFHVPTGKDPVRVFRKGYAPSTFVVPVDAPDPVRVVLKTGNLLTVRLKDDAGRPPASVTVEIQAHSGALFDAGAMDTGVFLHSDNWTQARQKPDEEGLVTVGGFEPGVEFTVIVKDEVSGKEVDRARLSLGATESRTLSFDVPGTERTLSGEVTGADGKPIEANVTVGGVYAWAREDGKFTIRGVRSRAVPIEIASHGYVTYRAAAFPVPEDGHMVRFPLERGRELEVVVRDANGKAVRPNAVEVRAEGHQPLKENGVGRTGTSVRFDGVPASEVTVRVTVAGRTFEQQVDATSTKVVVEVPVVGKVTVRMKRPPEQPARVRIRLMPRDGAGAEVAAERIVTTGAGIGGVTFPAVLPGTYEVVEEYQAFDPEGATPMDPSAWRPFGGTKTIEVAPGKALDIDLR